MGSARPAQSWGALCVGTEPPAASAPTPATGPPSSQDSASASETASRSTLMAFALYAMSVAAPSAPTTTMNPTPASNAQTQEQFLKMILACVKEELK